MKIVYCISGTFNSGGMERVLANKANYLARHGYDIAIITTDQKKREHYFPLEKNIICYDLAINYGDIQEFPLFKKSVAYINKQSEHRKKLIKLLKNLQANIVISMFDHEVSFLHKITDGSRKILEIHFSRFKRLQYDRSGLWKAINKWRSHNDFQLVKRYDRFVVLTKEDSEYWGKLNNITVIPNANSFESNKHGTLLNKEVIAVGRYDYQKGFDNLIHLWKLIHLKHPEWKLNIYGNGPLKEEYLKLIENSNLQNVVKLHPPVKNIKEEYLKHAFLVMTSRYEGFGMVLTEAQVCGLPVIAYACKCGPRDIINDQKNGFLIDEGNELLMVERISQLIDNIDLRQYMGTKGVEMSARFSEKQVMKLWINLFNELI